MWACGWTVKMYRDKRNLVKGEKIYHIFQFLSGVAIRFDGQARMDAKNSEEGS